MIAKYTGKLLAPLTMILFMAGCQPGAEKLDLAGFESFGDVSKHATESADVISPIRLVSGIAEMEGKTVTVTGTVREVCQQAGCWLTLDTSTESGEAPGTTIRISVLRDDDGAYVFTVPTDISGRTVFVTGVVEEQEVDAAMAKHYEDDAAKMAEHHPEDQGDHDAPQHDDADGLSETSEMDESGPDEDSIPLKEIRITAVGVSLAPVVTSP